MEDVNLLLKGYKEEAVCSNVRIELKKKKYRMAQKKNKKKKNEEQSTVCVSYGMIINLFLWLVKGK